MTFTTCSSGDASDITGTEFTIHKCALKLAFFHLLEFRWVRRPLFFILACSSSFHFQLSASKDGDNLLLFPSFFPVFVEQCLCQWKQSLLRVQAHNIGDLKRARRAVGIIYFCFWQERRQHERRRQKNASRKLILLRWHTANSDLAESPPFFSFAGKKLLCKLLRRPKRSSRFSIWIFSATASL